MQKKLANLKLKFSSNLLILTKILMGKYNIYKNKKIYSSK